MNLPIVGTPEFDQPVAPLTFDELTVGMVIYWNGAPLTITGKGSNNNVSFSREMGGGYKMTAALLAECTRDEAERLRRAVHEARAAVLAAERKVINARRHLDSAVKACESYVEARRHQGAKA